MFVDVLSEEEGEGNKISFSVAAHDHAGLLFYFISVIYVFLTTSVYL